MLDISRKTFACGPAHPNTRKAMTVEVSVLHVASNRYLCADTVNSSTVYLQPWPFTWTLDATRDEVANYTFDSCLFYYGSCAGSASGHLDTGSQNLLALVGTQDFVFRAKYDLHPANGQPLKVTQSGITMWLNVDEFGFPVFGEDDSSDNSVWIVTLC
jgi:hypothetical protein